MTDPLRCLRAERGAADLLVLLPGAYMRPEDFVEADFFGEVQRRGLALDLCAVAIDMATVSDGRAADAVRQQILAPARSTHQRVWLGGISLGGLMSMEITACHPQLVDGLCLMAPYPGSRLVTNAIERAGGIDAWQPGVEALRDPDTRVWNWLKAPPPAMPVFVGHGRLDRFAQGMAQIAERFPPASRHVVEGDHDWPAWRVLWSRFLEAGHFPSSASSHPPGP
jgi:pimeloyl-ACP methyl ester carboxylesterase